MERYTGDPADKPTVVKKLNDKGMPPTKKINRKYKMAKTCACVCKIIQNKLCL